MTQKNSYPVATKAIERLGDKDPVFASVHPDANTIRLETDEVIGAPRDACALLAEFPQLCLVQQGGLSHGGGIHFTYRDEEVWLPAPLVRGHRGPTDQEWEAAPDWACDGYYWYMFGE